MFEDLQDFLAVIKVEYGLADATVTAYKRDLIQFAEFALDVGIGDWDQVTLDHVYDFLDLLQERELAASSIARKLVAVKVFFRHLLQERRVERNVTEVMKARVCGIRCPICSVKPMCVSCCGYGHGRRIRFISAITPCSSCCTPAGFGSASWSAYAMTMFALIWACCG